MQSSSTGSRRSAGSSGGGGLQLTTSTGERERKRGDGRGRQDINTPGVLYSKFYPFNHKYSMLAPITYDKNLNADESIHVVCATHSQDCVTHLSLSYDSRKNVTSLMIFPSRLFSAELLPHLCEGLTFTLPVSKSYSHFLELLGSETD